MRRSDQRWTSGHRSSGNPSRWAVRRAGRGAASSETTSTSPRSIQRVDQPVHDPDQQRFEVPHPLRGEPARDQPAVLGVDRVVEGDHVRFVRRVEGAVPQPRDEDVVATLHVHHIGMVGDGPQPVLLVAGQRPGLAQAAERLVHAVEVHVELGVQQIGDLGHRRAAGCDCHRTAPPWGGRPAAGSSPNVPRPPPAPPAVGPSGRPSASLPAGGGLELGSSPTSSPPRRRS